MTDRNYSNTAVQTELAVSVTDTDIYLQMVSVTNWPAPPFTITVEPDSVGEEVCLVTNLAGNTATVTRGYDGTTAIAHLAGSTVKHAATAIDFHEANTHVNSTTGVHGIADTDDLETKAGAQSKADAAQLAAEGTAAAALAAHGADGSSVHGVTGSVVGTTDAQTLTNKTIDYNLNTILNLPPGPTGSPGADGTDGVDGVDGTDGQSAYEAAVAAGFVGDETAWLASLVGPAGPAGADGADGVGVPAGGTTGQMLVKASDDDYDFEFVDAGSGGGGGATGGGTDEVFYENDTNVTTNYTITTGKNAMTAGPVTIDSGVTVTVPSGSAWVIV